MRMSLSNYLNKKPNENLTFKLTETKNGSLSADIDKIIKKEQLENTNNKEDKPVKTVS